VWFGDKERALATTVTSIASVMGVIFGFVFPIFFLSDDDRDDPNVKDKIWFYTLIQSITITVMAIPIFFLVKNKPETPPSKSAKDALKMKKRRILESIIKLCKIPNYWIIVLAYSFVFSVYIVLGASVGAISDAYDYDTSSNSLFGGIFVICGVVGSIINAILLDRFGKYKIQF
jgi:nitrate/nitrite transporter NarK